MTGSFLVGDIGEIGLVDASSMSLTALGLIGPILTLFAGKMFKGELAEGTLSSCVEAVFGTASPSELSI